MILFCAFSFAQNEFITLWQPGKPYEGATTTQIYFSGVGNNYTIYWEEVGNPSHNGTLANVTTLENTTKLINFGTGISTDSQYLIKVSNGIGNFHRFNGYSIDRDKLLEVKQWGNIKWSNMFFAFNGCSNLDITATDVPDLSGVTNLSAMFQECNNLKGNSSFNLWNTSNITDMGGMFIRAKNFNQDIGNWNISNVTDLTIMFAEANNFNQNISDWDTSKVTGMASMFSKANKFNQNISNWNTSNVTNMSGMFSRATDFNQNISNWDTSKVVNMESMFFEASNFNQDIGNWNTSKVINMSDMFWNATNFNQDIRNWDTSKVSDMSNMFLGAKNFNQNIGNWNTSNVTKMDDMFNDCKTFNQDIGNWNTSNVTDMSQMFANTESFNQNLGKWDTSKVTLMYAMFYNSRAFNQNIENWNTSKVTEIDYMFYDATLFNQNLGKWNLKNVNYIEKMFKNSNLSCQNYDKILIGWANNPETPNGLQFIDNANTIYSSHEAVNARNHLINTKGWTISGDTYDPNCALSTNELQNIKIQVYPNPAKDFIFINNIQNSKDVEIYDMQGKMVKRQKYNNNQISLKNLSKGIYILKIPSEKYTQKIIIE